MGSRPARNQPRKRSGRKANGLKALALAGEDDQLAKLADLDSDQRAQTLLSEIGRLKRRLTAVATHEALIVDAVKQSLTDLPIITIPKPPPVSKRGTEEVPILHLSDTHIGKTTPTYDSSVAELRVQKALAATLEIIKIRRTAAVVNEARIYLGGDMVEGEVIFGGQPHFIDQNVFEQSCNTGPKIIAQAILTLMGAVKTVRVIAVPGNHGRSGGRHSQSSCLTNWDSVLYEVVRLLVNQVLISQKRHGDIVWDLPSDRVEDWYAVDNVLGWGNLLVHGHEIRGGFAGFPWYGLGRKAGGWIDTIPEPWQYLFMGHFHIYMRVDHGRRTILANGSTESMNVFARQEMASCGEPKQRLAIFNRRLGLVTDNPLYLADDAGLVTQGAKRRVA